VSTGETIKLVMKLSQHILNYITMFYNSYRLHSTLGYVSLEDYEKQLTEMKKDA